MAIDGARAAGTRQRSVAPGRLRPAAVRLVLMLVVFTAVSAAAEAAGAAAGTTALGSSLVGLVSAAGALALYAGAVRVLERRRAAELALRAAPSGLGRGFVLGVALFAGTIGVIAAFGGYRVTGWGSGGGALAALGLMASVAVSEELLFRGIVFRIVEELTGTWGALVVSGLVFGALHLVNPGATAEGGLAIAVEAGAMLGAAYAATRTLWLPIGLHLGWNLAEGGIFGTVVSGSGHHLSSLLTGATTGPVSLTGGSFGPEASLVAVVACSVVTVLLLRLAHQRGRVHPRPRRPAGAAVVGPAGAPTGGPTARHGR